MGFSLPYFGSPLGTSFLTSVCCAYKEGIVQKWSLWRKQISLYRIENLQSVDLSRGSLNGMIWACWKHLDTMTPIIFDFIPYFLFLTFLMWEKQEHMYFVFLGVSRWSFQGMSCSVFYHPCCQCNHPGICQTIKYVCTELENAFSAI